MARSKTVTSVRGALRDLALAIGRRSPIVLSAVRARSVASQARSYRALWDSIAVEPSVVVFESFEGRGFTDSPRALYQAMLRDPRFAGTEKVWAFRAPLLRALQARGGYDIRGIGAPAPGDVVSVDLDATLGARALEELRAAVIVPFKSPEYRRTHARASVWISNTVVPSYMALRPGQTYLQAWHGTPFKRLGCDIPSGTAGSAGMSVRDIHERYRHEGARLTWLLSQSPYATDKLGSAFDLVSTGRTGAIIEAGYPRNDFLATFTEEDVVLIRTRLGVPEGKRVILYAPTWRENQHTSGVGYTFETEADFDALREALGDEYVVLFRAHCLVASTFDFAAHGGFVIDASSTDDISDLYVISDVLVTDYSSVFFDYGNLRRPVIFYMYDLDQYAGEVRGLYLGLDELPGPVVRTTRELIDALRASEHPTAQDVAGRERFRGAFSPLDDGHASERVIQRMLAGGAKLAGTDRAGGGSAS
jgi:CDP-glycerol glycerophosphotransferase